jgi:hypothetical protein
VKVKVAADLGLDITELCVEGVLPSTGEAKVTLICVLIQYSYFVIDMKIINCI